MSNFFRYIIFIFFLIASQLHAYAQQVEKNFQYTSGVNLHTTLGGHIKPIAVMVSHISEEQLMNECSFFGGDSLIGFDFDANKKLASLHGAVMYGEFKSFMFKKQAEFVKRKYNIIALPYEIAAESKTVIPPPVIAIACTNLDFENGDFSNWVTARGYNANSNNPLTVMASPAYLNINQDVHSCDDLNIISAVYGNDPYSGYPGLDPAGGTYSARVGGMDMNTAAGVPIMLCDANKYMTNGINIPSNSNGEVLSQTFVVSSANALISYDYSVVLNAGGHANGEQPYFHVSVTDNLGNVLNPCTEYYVQGSAGVAPPGFVDVGTVNPQDGSALYVQNWVSNSVNLTPFIGQTVTLKFEAAGCIYGGHMAWAYIEATCSPVDITIAPPNPCAGGTAIFTAPNVTGGSYSWVGPGIVGPATSQTVTVNASGVYSVTITPSQGVGCAYTLTSTATFNSPSISGTTTTPSNCAVSSGTATANVTGGNGAYTYLWALGGQTTQTATGLSAGIYTVTITDANGCTAVGTQSVTSFPPVVAGFSVTTVCLGNPTTFTDQSNAATTSWSWNFGDAGTSIQQSPTHTYTAAGTFSATLTSTGAGGCNSSVTHIVTVHPQPIANFSVTTVCFGSPTQFGDLSTGGTSSWSWNFGDGNTSIQQNPSNTYSAAGTYTAILTATGVGGCNAGIPKVVIVNPQPIANFSVTTVCFGNATLFADLSNAATTSWAWNFGDGNTSTQQNPTNTYSIAGTFSATLTATGVGGCNSVVTNIVTVNPQPIANFSVTTVCLGNPSVFNDLSTGGATQWSWNFGDGNTSAQQNPSNTYSAAGTYTATLTSTGVGGCNSGISNVVNIFSLSVANFSVNDICLNTNPAVFNDQSTGAAQWAWNFGDGSAISSQQNPTHIYGAPGTYSVSLLVQSGGTCIDSIVHIINVNPVPNAIFTSSIVCFNNPTQFTDQSLGIPTQWHWDFGDGNTSVSQNPTHTYGTSGTFTVTLIATNALGCSDTLPITALVHPLPAANFIAPTVCVGSTTCFTDLTTIPTGALIGWSWNFSDPNSGANNISNIQNPCHLFSAVGTYNVILTVTSNNNCQSTINLPINVTLPPVAAFTATNACLNSPTSFTDGSTGALQWSWNFGDGGTSITQNPAHIYLGYGNYIVTLIASSGGLCADTFVDTINVNPLPIVNFKSDSVCVGKLTSFSDASFMPAGNIVAWGWNFGDPVSGINNTSNLQNPTHVFSSAGTYSVTLTATSAAGCISSSVVAALVYPGPVANFTFSPVSPVNLLETVFFTDLSTGSPVQWWWSFGDNDTSILQNPDHHFPDIGTYTVTLIAITQNGCTDTIDKSVEIQQYAFYIPNAFTPGIDGNNDFFFGKGVGIVEYEMWIFDRWGNRIFYCKVNDLPQTLPCMWDGKVEAGSSNERAQEDVYVWKVELLDIFGESHSYIGSVTLVK